MEQFTYKKEALTIKAYGKTLTLAKKTPALMESISVTAQSLQSTNSQLRAVYDSIGAIIGGEERDGIYPVYEDTDVDEMGAFWLSLCKVYGDRGSGLISEYLEKAKRP